MPGQEMVFWAVLLLLFYTFAGYPLLIWAWAALRPRPVRRGTGEPLVTLLVAAYNEAPRIAGRIENLLSLDYPRDRLHIIIASDGSVDGTMERARAYAGAGVDVLDCARRRGKPATLNDAVARARGELLVFADARQRFEKGALRALVAPFQDSRVGAVSGELMLVNQSEGPSVGRGVGFYWRYEKFIRRHESRVDSTVGVTGAIYAVRRDLFDPLPEDTLLDDVVVPMRIVRKGYRVLFEPNARAYDRASAIAQEEFIRKVRTISGNFQLFARERWLLNPFRNRLWIQTISHKGLRLLLPVLLVTLLWTSLLVWEHGIYRWALAGQGLFYAAAFGGFMLHRMGKRLSILAVPYVLCLLSWATAVALFRFTTGRQAVTWGKIDLSRGSGGLKTAAPVGNDQRPAP